MQARTDLINQNFAFCGRRTALRGCTLNVIKQICVFGGVTWLTNGGLKVIAGCIRGYNLQITEDCVRVVRLEFPKETALINAQFQINLLDHIIENCPGGCSPSAGSPEYGSGNHLVEALDELLPSCRMT